MPDILHRVGIKTSAKTVREALTTVKGLARWWVADAAGSAKKGGTIDFGFCHMKVVDASPHKIAGMTHIIASNSKR